MFLKKSAACNNPPFFKKQTQLTKAQQIGHIPLHWQDHFKNGALIRYAGRINSSFMV
ncbi:hypothetical protein SAMN05660461_5073 [Chitinophaga ginsengisegetis]|uniref:Uncharacterized protein n=1 Tax=Chitinophaga ginsengisegetis TaxID=393003 RepID=A0A1T5P8W7_9BACT|nr:hypothetical protein [Chitinophaga ginsengisegetis]MDR6650591.1 hypothetical protein [Chitinophaga ginsengisegetis]MDR6656770.1 hypothetical protein [Chitinophaga ginsengisegetis]SKD09190.1 hypothetical protein SAMN05660461_5073 [Chitinophaga ginsengisegetis]